MYDYILFSNYDNKPSPISESLTWTNYDGAKKFISIEEAEDFFETIPLDISGYFSIAKIINNGSYLDLGYHWENGNECFYMKQNQRIVKTIPNKTANIELDEETKKALIGLANKGLEMFLGIAKDFSKMKDK